MGLPPPIPPELGRLQAAASPTPYRLEAFPPDNSSTCVIEHIQWNLTVTGLGLTITASAPLADSENFERFHVQENRNYWRWAVGADVRFAPQRHGFPSQRV